MLQTFTVNINWRPCININKIIAKRTCNNFFKKKKLFDDTSLRIYKDFCVTPGGRRKKKKGAIRYCKLKLIWSKRIKCVKLRLYRRLIFGNRNTFKTTVWPTQTDVGDVIICTTVQHKAFKVMELHYVIRSLLKRVSDFNKELMLGIMSNRVANDYAGRVPPFLLLLIIISDKKQQKISLFSKFKITLFLNLFTSHKSRCKIDTMSTF